ncbi:hypothetical protein MBANPS3_003915 [Mucor bainieri]
MADELVEHRFVQIYQACEKASSKLDDFWNTLAQTSAIAVSHGCEKIYTRVTQSSSSSSSKEFDLFHTIQSLQNLILTSDDATKNTILLRTITQLIVFHQQHTATDKAKTQFHHNSKTDSQQQQQQQQKVHPYATLMRQKPTLYFDLLEEVDYLLVHHASVAIPVAQGFIAAVFLTDAANAVDPHALLMRLTNAIMADGNSNGMMADVYACITDILFQYPLHKESDRYLALIDFLMWTTIISKPYAYYQQQQQQADQEATTTLFSTTDYIYPFMDRLVGTAANRDPIMSYLARLERMMADSADAVLADVMWVCLSCVLLDSQNVMEQQAIVRLIKPLHAKVSGTVSRIAYLPLYQLLSELNDKDASQGLKTLKDDTLHMLYALDNIQHESSSSSTNVDQASKQQQASVQTLMHTNTIYGPLAHLLVYLDGFYNDAIPVLHQGYNAGPDATLALNILFSTPYAYDADVDTQCLVLSRITELCSSPLRSEKQSLCKFPMLLFLLRVLRASFDEPRLVAHLFKDVMPMLADPSDPTLTSKVLQVILSSISSGDTMASLGVKALAHTHQRQPRVWQELKRVFAEWVLRRKSGTVRRKVDLSVRGPIQLELAVLTTMRDVCKTRPRECAPDVLPMVMSLLQTCQDLSMASLSVLMATINHCVTAGLVEPRSIWNIAVVYLAQFAVDQGTHKSALLVQALCAFYSIAGARNDTSEPYLQFKQHLLTDHVLPLIDCNDPHAAQHAMLALSAFSAQDMAAVLPEKAADYVQHATPADDHPIENQECVLATLMSNELDHMRRGLFKEEASKKQASSSSSSSNDTSQQQQQHHTTNDAGHVVGEREAEIQALLSQLWEDARVAPGLRSGYAIAMLHTLQSKDTTPALQDMSKAKWYRFMVTSFTDVSLTDHLLLRVSSIDAWKTFFQNALFRDAAQNNEVEAMVSVLIKDLLARLERSTVPGVTCNIAMAITGLVLVVQRYYAPSFAASCASEVIEILMTHYIVLSGSPLSHSAHLMSEEVQFAARFALGHLAPCIISNDTLVQQMHTVLLDAATHTTSGGSNNKYRNIDTSVDLVQFANGYAAGHFVASLTVYPAATDSIDSLKTAGLASLQQYYMRDDASDSRVVGILMGLASQLKPAMMCDADTVGDELNLTSTKLKAYLNGESISKGLLLGSTWVVALGALQEYGVEHEYANIIESVMAAASRDASLAQHFYHFVVPYTHILYHGHVAADAEDEAAMSRYTQAFEPLFGSVQSDDASSHYRIASLFGIAGLLGVDYLDNRHATSNVYIQAQRYEASSRRAGLEKLAAIAGLTVKSAPTGNLKSGRIAAAACGHVLAHTRVLMQALDSDRSTDASSTGAAAAADAMAALASASSEPINYNRLNSNTSYLRAVFDKLTQLANDASTSSKHSNMAMLLKGLTKTPGPLPPVNWFALLLKLGKISSDMQQLCFAFAATHAATSFSLSEYLATQTMALLKQQQQQQQDHGSRFLFESTADDAESAFGTLLMLGGLPARIVNKGQQEEKKRRGMNAVTKKMSLSESRILELVKLLAERFQSFDPDTQYAALSTLADHLPSWTEQQLEDEAKSKLVSSLYTLVFESLISQMLLDSTSTTEKVLRQAVACTRPESIEQLLPTARLDDWSHVSPVINYLIYLCESYHLSKKTKKQQSIIKYISTAVTYLIGASQGVEGCWRVVADMIADDCQTDQDALGWIIRVLDAFVVYISGFHTAEQFDQDVLMKAIYTGLHAILMELRSSSSSSNPGEEEEALDVSLQIADTAYLLDYFIGIASGHQTEQEQIVKRIFKLLGMVRHLQSADCTDFFKRVVLGVPSVYLTQYQVNVHFVKHINDPRVFSPPSAFFFFLFNIHTTTTTTIYMWNRLPPELYLRIIHYIDDPLQIKQCRLVCRQWNHPDARFAQLVFRIALTTIEDARRFYEYMKKHPTKGRFVRKIILGNNFHWNQTLLGLMDLAVTPYLEVMQGQLPYNENIFYNKLNAIIAASSPTASSWKLQVIPENKLFSDSYLEALLALKHSLETIHLDLYSCAHGTHLNIDLITARMVEFARLTKLSLKGPFRFHNLVALLQACHHLLDLYLEPDLQDDPAALLMLQASTDQFQVRDTLKTLKIGQFAPICVVEHLMSVHPRVEYVAINAPWYYSGSMEATLNLLDAIKHVPYYEMNCIVDDRDDTVVDSIVSFIERDRAHVSVSKFDDTNRPEIVIQSQYSIY